MTATGEHDRVTGSVDVRAVAAGALTTLAFGVPPVLLVQAVQGGAARHDAGLRVIAALVAIVVAPLVGGVVAARHQPHAALTHGAWAASAGYAGDVVLAVARRAITGGGAPPLHLLPAFVLFLVVFSSLGMLGGYAVFRRSLR